ncbi:MAG: hypothetical protein JW990_16410 [Thermoleophilia bacterium]|nr:hypothetical protein [Thermoleophilia bacterium]
MSALEIIPKGRHATASITRRGALAGIGGTVVLSLSMFTDAPMPMLALVSVGGLLILVSCLAGAVVALFSPFREEK